MIDTSKDLIVSALIAPAALSEDNTPAAVDVFGARDATILLCIGVGGITFTSANKVEFVLTHSDDNSTYANVTAADLVGVDTVTNGIVKSLTAAHATADVTKIGYVGGKRYIKLLADFSGTHGTATPMAAYVVQADAYKKPV